MQPNTVLNEVLRLTKAIEQAVAVGDWEGAASLASERTPLVHTIQANQTPAAMETIRAIQAIDRAVMDHAGTAQQELGAEYQTAMKSVRGANQYQAVARL